MSETGHNTKNYEEHGGSHAVIGGTFELKAGAAVVLGDSALANALNAQITGTASVAAELDELHGAPSSHSTLSVGAESAHAIVTTVQLKDGAGLNVAYQSVVEAWLSDTAGGGLTATDPTTNTAVGGSGAAALASEGGAHKTLLRVVSGSTGSFTVTTTQTAAHNYYLNIACPLTGKVLSSSVIAHAG